MVGMAFMAAQAKACLPFLNCATCASWQEPQVSGVGIFTLATSAAEVCWSPWQASQPTSTWLWRLSFQSETILGVILLWHSMHWAVGLGGGWVWAAISKHGKATRSSRAAKRHTISAPPSWGGLSEPRRRRVCDCGHTNSGQERSAKPAASSFHSRYQLAMTVKVVATRSLLLRAKPMAISTMLHVVNTSSAVARVWKNLLLAMSMK